MLPFIDLKYQYSLIRDEIHAGIDRVLESGHYILGAEIAELEKQLAEYAGVKHALACSSGTDALLMALMALGIGPGDAVFTTPFTFFATVETIALVGATPVFADIDEGTYNIDPAKLEEAILKIEREGKLKPKAVIPVDLFGLTADYKAIKPLADAHGLAIIEDACQAFGAVDPSGKRAPSLGTIGCTSFFPAKPLGCYGDGGAVFTDDDEIAGLLNSFKVHGKGPKGKYDNVRIGLNSRLDTLQAAVLLAKLDVLEEEIEARQRVAARYNDAFRGKVQIPAVSKGNISAYAQYCVLAENSELRQQVLDTMKEAEVPSLIYYPNVLHELDAFAPYEGDRQLMAAKKYAECNFGLPFSPYLTEEDQQKVIEVVLSAL